MRRRTRSLALLGGAHDPRRNAALTLLFSSLLIAWLLIGPADREIIKLVDNVAQFAGPLLALPWCLASGRFPRLRRGAGEDQQASALRWVSLLFGLSIASEALGQIIWTYYEQVLREPSPFPSWADAAYLTLYPPLLAGILLLPTRPLAAATRLRFLLDGLMVMTVVAAFSWYFLLEPTIDASATSASGKIVGAAYTFADLILIACLLALWLRGEIAALRPTLALLGTALAVIITTDTIYEYQTLHGSYLTGELLDVGWPLGLMLVGVAASSLPVDGAGSRPAWHRPLERPAGEDPPPAASSRYLILPFALVPLLGALVIYARQQGGDRTGMAGVDVAAAVLVCLLLGRQMFALQENRGLFERLNAAYTMQGEGLARRVAELEWLRDASRQVNAADSLESVLDVTYDAIRFGLGFDRIGINLFNHEEGTFEDWIGTDAMGVKTWPRDRKVRLTRDSAIWRFPGIAAVLAGEDIYYTTNATAECPPELRYLYDGEPAHNLMVALRAGDRITGVISVDNLVSGRPIAPQDAKPLQALAYQVALAVERTRAEAALRASDERLRTVVQTAPIGLLALDRDGTFILSSGGALDSLGVPIGGTVGTAIGAAFADQPELTAGFAQALDGIAGSVTLERQARTIELHWLPQADAAGAVQEVIGVAIDVTERAKAQREADRTRRAAEELALLRSDFVAAVSHELRTPLTGIIGYAELLQARWAALTDEQRLDHTRRIVLSARRQQRLVEDLLLLSRMESGVFQPRLEAFGVAGLVQRAAEEVQGSYRGQRIDLEGPADLLAFADHDRALQIMVNLLDNAAKYSPEDGAIAVSWRREGAQVTLRVCDRGPGIPVEGQSLLFTRFGRVPGSRTRAGRVGTGLGLYLGRRAAEAMGGTLDLEASGPTGSVFRLRLPFAPD